VKNAEHYTRKQYYTTLNKQMKTHHGEQHDILSGHSVCEKENSLFTHLCCLGPLHSPYFTIPNPV